MQVICISKGTFGGGKELAERTAKKLDYTCLSREQLIEAATREGIQVGKLEMSMIKTKAFLLGVFLVPVVILTLGCALL